MPALHTLSTEILVYTQIPNAPIFSLYTQRCSLLIPQIFGSLHFSRVYTMVNYRLYLQCDAIKRLGWSYSETIHCTVNHPNQNLIQCIQVHICAYLLKLLSIISVFLFVFVLLRIYSVYLSVAVTVLTNLPPPTSGFKVKAAILVLSAIAGLPVHHCYTIILVQSALAGVQLHHC